MKLQGTEVEDGQIKVEVIGETTLQTIYANLRNFFELNNKVTTFEVLKAIKKESCWEIRCYFEQAKQVRIVSVKVSIVGGAIQSVEEEFRANG